MATNNTFTIKAFYEHFMRKMRERIEGVGANQFRQIKQGAVTPTDYMKPFLGVECVGWTDARLREGDVVKELKMKVRACFDYSPGESVTKAMDMSAIVDNFCDDYAPPEGVTKIEKREWAPSVPSGDPSGLAGFVDGTFNVNVTVARGANK